MGLNKNPSGKVWFDSEKELYEFLERTLLPTQFGEKWESQYQFSGGTVDYLAKNGVGLPVFIEVKNDFLSCKDHEQIMKYHFHACQRYGPQGYDFVLICKGAEDNTRHLVEELGFLDTKIIEIHQLVSQFGHSGLVEHLQSC